MKTLWKVLKVFFGSLAALVFLVSVSVFMYHHYQLNKEAALLKGKGTLVDVDGKKMNVYEEEAGRIRLCLCPVRGSLRLFMR